MWNKWKNIGPGVLVAAAFIGPGTVTLCTIAGVKFGFSLLWAMLLSILATIILQEMAARLGIITQQGLAAIIRKQVKHPLLQKLVVLVILGAIVIGNAAYEGGNVGGATIGLAVILGDQFWIPLLIGTIAFILLWIGNYMLLEKVLVFLVILMSLAFVATASITKPDLEAIFKGMFVPSIPEGSLFTIIGLIGTTVVPYNLFLHASLVKEKWATPESLSQVRRDTVVSIGLGGLVSMAIIIAAVAIPGDQVASVVDLASGLEPLFGSAAKYFLGIGLFASGITSAITAPLAAAYVVNNCFGWETGLKDYRFRIVWILILVLGVGSLMFNIKPIQIIQFAQIANGILLPLIAILLLWIVNKRNVLGAFRNTFWQNALGLFIVIVTIGLGVKSIIKVLDWM